MPDNTANDISILLNAAGDGSNSAGDAMPKPVHFSRCPRAADVLNERSDHTLPF
ncbi:MAG: hypothetical protein HS105_09315 [Chloracidobacterium sp.]|nr:hypothetical protein [Chloracidobacterium sp.]MCC6824950.1 hypothetical protein [Acidobacteriota bacterium]MCO5333235.1 hypothetical protein [Pyrinomonadaceae bacterium]